MYMCLSWKIILECQNYYLQYFWYIAPHGPILSKFIEIIEIEFKMAIIIGYSLVSGYQPTECYLIWL